MGAEKNPPLNKRTWGLVVREAVDRLRSDPRRGTEGAVCDAVLQSLESNGIAASDLLPRVIETLNRTVVEASETLDEFLKRNPPPSAAVLSRTKPSCPDCERFMKGQWRTGRCDECRGSGRDENDESCKNCDGTGSPVCCKCEGTGVDPDIGSNPPVRKQRRCAGLNEAFWKWFSDSVVRNEDGTPKVVYHGTLKRFKEFDMEKCGIGCHFGDKYQAMDRSHKLIACYLSIKNPIRMQDRGQWDAHQLFLGMGESIPFHGLPISVMDNPNGVGLIKEFLESNGYDGIIYRNIYEGAVDDYGNDLEPRDSYIAFHPEQIKSINNDGTWDADDPNIRSNPEEMNDGLKKWFNGSQVVDEHGEPLLVYHGSHERGLPKISKMRTCYGLFFSPDMDTAGYYAGDDCCIYKAYLKVKNLADFDDDLVFDAVAGAAFGGYEGKKYVSQDRQRHGEEDAEMGETEFRSWLQKAMQRLHKDSPSIQRFLQKVVRESNEAYPNDQPITLKDLNDADIFENVFEYIDDPGDSDIAALMKEEPRLQKDFDSEYYTFDKGVDDARKAYGSQDFYMYHQDDMLKAAERLGYDGVVLTDPSSSGEAISYVVFSPNQIRIVGTVEEDEAKE